MPPTSHPNPLRPLNPVRDSDATRRVTAETHARLLAAIMAEPDREAGGRRVGLGVAFAAVPRGRRRLVAIAGVITMAAAIVLTLPGLLAGGGSTTQPPVAQAHVLARIYAALSRPGTIVIEDQIVHEVAGGYTQRNVTFSVENITETSARGHQQRTFVTGSYMRPGFQNVWTSNWESVYDGADNTIYEGAENNGGPAFIPGEASTFKQELDQHLYRLDGSSMIAGRTTLKLVPVRATLIAGGDALDSYPTVYVSPTTYQPIRLVDPAPPGSKVRVAEVITWLAYKVLPATAANRRLVSLTARHPHARVVTNTAAMHRVYSHEDLN